MSLASLWSALVSMFAALFLITPTTPPPAPSTPPVASTTKVSTTKPVSSTRTTSTEPSTTTKTSTRTTTSPKPTTTKVTATPVMDSCAQSDLGMAIQVWESPAKLSATMDAVKRMGATSVRLDLPWQHVEARRGVYDWQMLDTAVKMASDKGLHVLAILDYTPKWAATHPHLSHSAPNPVYLPDWNRFVKATVNRYKGSIRDWEIWNEPNIHNFWGPQPAAKDYIPFLKGAYTSIKSIQPGTTSTVISAGLAPAADISGAQSPVTFLKQMYDNGAKDYFDDVAMHPYAYPYDPTDPNRPGNGSQGWIDGWTATLKMREEMERRGDGAKSIWLSEYGVPTGLHKRASTEQEQAQIMKNSWLAAKDIPWVEKTHLYTMVDPGTNKYDLEHNFGLLRNDMSVKPAYTALKQANGC